MPGSCRAAVLRQHPLQPPQEHGEEEPGILSPHGGGAIVTSPPMLGPAEPAAVPDTAPRQPLPRAPSSRQLQFAGNAAAAAAIGERQSVPGGWLVCIVLASSGIAPLVPLHASSALICKCCLGALPPGVIPSSQPLDSPGAEQEGGGSVSASPVAAPVGPTWLVAATQAGRGGLRRWGVRGRRVCVHSACALWSKGACLDQMS